MGLEPAALRARPHYGRFPIPYITYVDEAGRPNFRVHNNLARHEVARRHLCQLCGTSLSPESVFVGLPGSIERGVFGEPPMHPDCFTYALEVCPWLAGRDWKMEWKDAAREAFTTIAPPEENAERLGIWTATYWRIVPDDEGVGLVKWRPEDQLSLRWWER